jgi:hypothetical protein
MEELKIPYNDAMAMPSSRRFRMCKRKADLEDAREAATKAELNKIKRV